MRPRPWILPVLLAAAAGALASPPSGYELRRALRGTVRRAAWVLVVRERDLPKDLWVLDETFLRLREDRDLTVHRAPQTSAATLWDHWHRGSDVRCLLVSRDFKAVLELPGLPTGAVLLQAMCAGGYQTVRDRREAFLREFPDHGEMLDEKLASALGVLEARLSAWPAPFGQPLPEGEADLLFADTADVLDQLLKLPDWWRFASLQRLARTLEEGKAGRSPRMRGIMAGMREAARDRWAHNPLSGSAREGILWIALERGLEQDLVRSLPDLIPAPGELWPGRFEINLLVRRPWVKGDWKAVAAFLESLPATLPDRASGAADWSRYVDRQAHVHLLLAVAYGRQQLWENAEASALDCRRWSGRSWAGVAAALRDALGTELPKGMATILALEAGQDWPVPAKGEPLRLARGGPPLPPRDLAAFRNDPAFLPWGPEELRWGQATPREEELMAPSLDTHADAGHWGVFRGSSMLLATWQDPAPPRTLARTLEAMDIPALAWLGPFIRRDPIHLDARRKRFNLIRSRMPCPALEETLAGDATSALLPLNAGQGGWRPGPGVWEAALSLAMPDLEAALRRWPTSSPLWATWLSWAPLHPDQPSPYAFAQALPAPAPRSRWICLLPEDVHRAVGRELLAARRLVEYRAWFQEAWEGLKLASEDLPVRVTAAQVELLYPCLRAALEGSAPAAEDLARERAAILERIPEPSAPSRSEAITGVFAAMTDLPAPEGVRKAESAAPAKPQEPQAAPARSSAHAVPDPHATSGTSEKE